MYLALELALHGSGARGYFPNMEALLVGPDHYIWGCFTLTVKITQNLSHDLIKIEKKLKDEKSSFILVYSLAALETFEYFSQFFEIWHLALLSMGVYLRPCNLYSVNGVAQLIMIIDV